MERVDACMDSHVHWLATGEFSQRLDLSPLTQPEDISKLQLHPHHFRGEWIFGFAWDQTKWPGSAFPTREILDRWQPHRPVVLSRCDGHSYWVNTEALRRAGMFSLGSEEISGGRVLRDKDGLPTGVLMDAAKAAIDKAIPKATPLITRRNLLKGAQIFNEAGITHVRDLTCTPEQWQEAQRLDETGLLTLAVEEFFWLEKITDLNGLIDFCRTVQGKTSPNLRAKGLKIFIDGSLGSESAHLSCPYHSGAHGVVLWEDSEVETILRQSFEAGLEVAVHAIGDEACARIVRLAHRVQAGGVQGLLHLEHAEVLRPETVAQMKNLNVICHLQPSHFLSDRDWLGERLGVLKQHAFPWRQLQENGIRFNFGSDSPLAPPSIRETLRGLKESEEAGIPRLLGNPLTYMSHPDHSWCPNTFSEFKDNLPVQVVFRGQHLL